MFKQKLFLLLCFLSWAVASQSAPRTWILNGVTFADGATATGSFRFDAETSTVSDWNISINGGNEFNYPPFNYTPVTAPGVAVFDPSAFGNPPSTAIRFTVDPFGAGGTRTLRLVTDAPLTDSGGTAVLTNQGNFTNLECYLCSPFRNIVSGVLNTAVPVAPAGCDIQLNQASFIDGETVIADVFRLVNERGDPVTIEWKIWLGIPGVPPVSIINAGADSSLELPANTDIDFGPLPIFAVSAALPRGSYEFSCRILDPVTGELFNEDLNSFTIQ